MSKRTLIAEARRCYNLAQDFVGRGEHDFLLKVADGFERLARQQVKPPTDSQHTS